MPDPIPFPAARRRQKAAVQAARCYRLFPDAERDRFDPDFLDKAAIFQEIRDSLADAEAGLISGAEAEARVSFFSRLYLYGDQSG